VKFEAHGSRVSDHDILRIVSNVMTNVGRRSGHQLVFIRENREQMRQVFRVESAMQSFKIFLYDAVIFLCSAHRGQALLKFAPGKCGTKLCRICDKDWGILVPVFCASPESFSEFQRTLLFSLRKRAV
jgi:hypothetical protein